MVTQTGHRVVRSNFCKGKIYPGKGAENIQKAKPHFWGQQQLFGIKLLKFGPKRANLATRLTGCGWPTASFRFLANDRQPCSDAKLPVWRHDRQAMKLATLRWAGRKFKQMFRFDWIPIMWNSTTIRANNALLRTNRFLTYRTHSVALAFNETVRCCFYY